MYNNQEELSEGSTQRYLYDSSRAAQCLFQSAYSFRDYRDI